MSFLIWIFLDAEWALMALPRQVRHLPLLDFFSRVTPKGVVVDKEVYVIHRSTLSSSNRVRAAVPEDLDHIGPVEYFFLYFFLFLVIF